MGYEAKPLPFSKVLQGISEKTLTIHHDKLYQGYVNKSNEIEEKLSSVDRSSANATYSEYGELKREESFAHNGVFLHEQYFMLLGGEGGEPSGDLRAAIEKDFGTYEAWLEDFKAAGMVARGWVVLAYNYSTQKLHNYVCDAHNQGGIWGAAPLIILDVYEHAYFIDYGSDRNTYIEDYFANFNWKAAEEIYTTRINTSI